MVLSKVIYKGGLRTEATHLRSTNIITTDAPVDNKGKGAAFSPTDLVATGLASCILTTIGIKANEHNWSIPNMSAEVIKTMSIEGPRRIHQIEIDIMIPNNTLDEKSKEIIYNTAINCPVSKSLHPDIKQIIRILYK